MINYLLYLWFCLLTFFIFQTSKMLVYFIRGIEEKTKISKGFIGLFFLSLATSLPEGISAIFSPLMSSPKLAFNNIFGANFLIIFVLALANLVFIKQRILTSFSKSIKKTIGFLIFVNFFFFAAFYLNYDFLILNISLWF